MRVALVHYHEIGLKGRNRGQFERRLERNVRWALRTLPGAEVRRIASRVLVRAPEDMDGDRLLATVAAVPGVAYVSYGAECECDPESIGKTALAEVHSGLTRHKDASTFAVVSRRSSTTYAESSMDINRRVGDLIRMETGLSVDLGNPDITVWVTVVQGAAYVWTRRIEGVGGLPVGTSGAVVSLLSSGIDSPVATWRIMRRGASIVGVHFSGRPQTGGQSEHYAAEIAQVLAGTGGMEKLYIVPFGDVQRQIALSAPESLRVVLYRRFMVRVAERIAFREDARALVTGESLGQVASQTLDNVATIDAVATMPVLRPLIGSDKQEIMAQARGIGTYDLSVACSDDCCSLFMPRRPETHASPGEADAGEAELDVEGLVTSALEGVSVIELPTLVNRGRRRTGARGRS
ncbi:MAG: tRNA uracil 4-sulfurtransferase ThiI [Coriobacteriia bacterium]|nr:tRNA uracil 4-sulfurtransferase ThiI [Coriobacteriia bacterium]